MKKLLFIILIFISVSAGAQLRFNGGKAALYVDSIVSNTDTLNFRNRTTGQKVKAVIKTDALVVKNVYTFTDTFTTNKAFRDSIAVLKLANDSKVNLSDSTVKYVTPKQLADSLGGVEGPKFYYNMTLDSALNWQFNPLISGFISSLLFDSTTFSVNNNNSFGGYLSITPNTSQLGNYYIDENNQAFIQLSGNTDKPKIRLYSDAILDNKKVELQIDSTGAHYIISPDTTLTTPLHLMTEAQVKREIAAKPSQWTTTTLGIKYDGGSGDSICIDNTGAIRNYVGGVLIYEMKSDGTIHQYSGGNEILYTTTKGAIGLKYNSLNNTAIGDSALNRNILGENNTAIGPFALWYNLNGNNNTAIGPGALEESLGSNNIAIGNESGRFNANLSNRIFINSLNRTDLPGDTTKSIIYGQQDATVANQRLYLNAGRVIISGQIKTLQISAALTDNTPTDAEIDTATGLTPATAGAGYQVTIKDNNGTGLLYKVESDGTDWYCWGGACNGTKLL